MLGDRDAPRPESSGASTPDTPLCTTTNQYIEIDMAMKREAIERCTPPVPEPTGDIHWRSRRDIIDWLDDL